MAARRLAHKHAVGIGRHQVQHRLVHQLVVEHQLGLRQDARGLHGEQIGVAGAGAHQGDMAGGWRLGRRRSFQELQGFAQVTHERLHRGIGILSSPHPRFLELRQAARWRCG